MKSARAILNAGLLRINRYTVEKRVRTILPWVKGDVLDIGCGSGYLAQYIGKGQRYVGVDVNEDRIHSLKHKYVDNSAYAFWAADVDKDMIADLAVFDAAFDTVSLLAVIEHLRNPGRLLSLLHEVLKDGGHLLITTPTSIGDRIGHFISATTSGRKEFPYPHMRIYDRASLTALTEETGFVLLCYRKFELGMNQLTVCSKKPV